MMIILAVQVLWYLPGTASERRMRASAGGQLVAVVMAAAEAVGGGTKSSRSWETRAGFELVPGSPNMYLGTQGAPLADFINYACADTNITSANWHADRQTVSKLGTELINIQPHPDRFIRYSVSGRSNRSIE